MIKLNCTLVLLLFLSVNHLFSATCTWIGDSSVDSQMEWNTGSNWDCGSAPNAADIANFNTNLDINAIISTNADILIVDGAFVNITSSAIFTFGNASLTVDNGSLLNNGFLEMRDVIVNSLGNFTNAGTILSSRDYYITLGNFINNGMLVDSRDIFVDGGNFTNGGTASDGRNLNITNNGVVTNAGNMEQNRIIIGDGDVSSGFLVSSGSIGINTSLFIQEGMFTNQIGGSLEADLIRLDSNGSLENEGTLTPGRINVNDVSAVFYNMGNGVITITDSIETGQWGIRSLGIFTNDGAIVISDEIDSRGILVRGSGSEFANGPTGTIGITVHPDSCAVEVVAMGIFFQLGDLNIAQGLACCRPNGICFPAIVLPLELVRFEGYPEEGYNILEWDTEWEENVEKFVIERSGSDGNDWKEQGEVSAVGWSSEPQRYSWKDETPLRQAYYRLRMIDFDGSEEISPFVFIEQKEIEEDGWAIFPTPVRNRLTLVPGILDWEILTVGITDQTGRLIEQKQIVNSDSGRPEIDFSGFPSGVYFLSILNEQGDTITLRVVKAE